MISFEFPAPAKLLNLNDRMHWRKRAELVAAWRQAAWAHARNTGYWLVPLGPSVIKITLPVTSLKTRRDPQNFALTTKSIVDGLVDAKFWKDDTREYVTVSDPDFWTARNVLVEIYPRKEEF